MKSPKTKKPLDQFESMKYQELQKLAKQAGIRANQKIDKLIKALKDHHKAQFLNVTSSNVNVSPASEFKNTPELTNEKNKDSDIHVVPQATRKRRRTFELEEATLGAALTPSSETKVKKRRSSVQTATPLSSTTGGEPENKRTRRGTFEKNQNDQKSTPISLNANGKRRKSNLPTPQSGLGSARKGKATFVFSNPETDVQSTRRNTRSAGSPGTHAIIASMDANVSSAERKANLMSVLNDRVKDKVASSPSQPSQIPRFMAFLANKKAAETQAKPTTPGKNWTKIHGKAFSKFDSIDVYLEKKNQRMENLTNSGKKAQAKPLSKKPRLAKPVQRPATASTKSFAPTVTSVRGLNLNFGKPKTPSKTAAPQPQSKTFVPSVTSVKGMSFNFQKIETPRSRIQTPRGKTPSKVVTAGPSASKVVKTTTPFQFTGTMQTMHTYSKKTPYKFVGNTSVLDSTASSTKKTFDLKASLAKPLGYKPKTGKLQPVDINKPMVAPAVKPNLFAMPVIKPVTKQVTKPLAKPAVAKPVSKLARRQAMASKSRLATAKTASRVQAVDRRDNQKYTDMMKRRGLM